MANQNLQAAKAAKKDEFYTQLPDIERELRHYKEHFKGKTVICNCDDPRVSNFYKFFSMKFEPLGLKRLICTCYKHQDVDLFGDHGSEKAVYIDYTGGEENILPLKGDGDFRSEECIELLKQADIVVTNPPFSLFREYVAQLMKYEKKFLIIGNQNAITYKEVFECFMKDSVWMGYHCGDMSFRVPDDYELRETRSWRDEEGHNWRSLGNACWYTNLDHDKRHEPLILYKKYSEIEYPTYDNYDAINVDKVDSIPEDFYEIMGVPITFLDKYCPEQFEILGLTDRQNTSGLRTKKYTIEHHPKYNDLNARGVIIKNGEYKQIYARILIRRKQQ